MTDTLDTLDADTWRAALIERITPPVYEKLSRASLAIAGLGGLGSQIALMLARAGVGHLHLVDFDRVDVSNLNRQAYRIAHLHRPKTEALSEMIREINPCMRLSTAQLRVDESNVWEIFAPYELVCEAFDKEQSKAMLVEELLARSERVRIVAASGLAGYASANLIRTRRAMSRLYLCGDGVSALAENEPLVATRVMLCAAHQAHMLLRLILDEEEV